MRRGFNSTLSRFLDGATSGFPPFPTNKQIEVPVSDRGTVFHGPDPTAWVEPMRRVISSSGEGEAADVGQPGRLQVAPRLGGGSGGAINNFYLGGLNTLHLDVVRSSHRAPSLGEPAAPLGLEPWVSCLWVLGIRLPPRCRYGSRVAAVVSGRSRLPKLTFTSIW
jgi:hypothetical protein